MRIREIYLQNNVLVKDRPIRREILLKLGNPYSLEKINLSKRHIYETGLFSSVNIQPANIDTVNHTLDLIAEVRELNMHYLGLKFGLGQDQGITSGSEPYSSLTMNGEWLHRNIAGRGSRLSTDLGLSLEMRTDVENITWPAFSTSVSYIEPWLFGFRSSTSFRIFFENQEIKEPQEEITKYGEETALIYQPDKRFRIQTGFLIQRIKHNIEPIVTEFALTQSIRRDYRDNFLFPSKGTVFTFDGKIVPKILDETQDYYKFETGFSQYFPLFGRIVFAYRGKFGYMNTFRKGDETPSYEKFYLGGGTSLRGWSERNFNKDGGDIKVLTNFEIRFPLFWLLGGEIFIDGGMLPKYEIISDRKSLSQPKYRWDAGFGLTIATPLGPIRIDMAKRLGEKKGSYETPLSIAYAF